MAEMAEPGAEIPQRSNRILDQQVSQERKDEARARILGKLITEGELYGTLVELREKLGLEDMSMRLFKEGCRYLSRENHDNQGKPLIEFEAVGDRDHGYRTRDPQAFRLKYIK